MDYFEGNKHAWEEAFQNRNEDYGKDMHLRLQREELPYLNPMLKAALRGLDLRGRVIAQFCCNNGRELLSAMQLGARAGHGFDIAGNMVAFARETARLAKLPCTFTECNIMEIGGEYGAKFDLVFFTIGAITWFQDLRALFAVASRCLTPGGTLLINDFHPFVGMLPLPGEDAYDDNDLRRLAYSYFRQEPWLENNGAGYMTSKPTRYTFTSFSHTMAAIVNAVIGAGMTVTRLDEFDTDVGTADAYDGMGYPLSFTLLAQKP